MCIYTHKMWEKYGLKDVAAFNQQFGKGIMLNESSLSFAISQANKTGSWLRACAYIVRAVLIDHVFEDGNKRTSAAVIIAFFKDNDIQFDQQEIPKGIAKILRKNITSLAAIEQVIQNAII